MADIQKGLVETGNDKLQALAIRQIAQGKARQVAVSDDPQTPLSFLNKRTQEVGLQKAPAVIEFTDPYDMPTVTLSRDTLLISTAATKTFTKPEMEALVTQVLSRQKLDLDGRQTSPASSRLDQKEAVAAEKAADRKALEVLCDKEPLISALRKYVKAEAEVLYVKLDPAMDQRITALQDTSVTTSGGTHKGCAVK